MADKLKNNEWTIDTFFGGLSEGSKRGYKGAFRAGQGLDYRTDPDLLSGFRKFTKDSGSTVVDMIKWFITQGTDLYAYGDSGKFYKRTDGGTWSVIATLSNSSGNGMALFNDYIYLATDSGLSRYGPMSGTPALTEDFLVSANEVDDSLSTSGNTYTLTTGVNEGATHKQTFTAGVTLIKGILLAVAANGTGDWTVELHDASNNVVGKVTVANASVVAAGHFKFVFPNPVTVTSGNAYHFHAYSTVADGTVTTTTNADFETALFSVHQVIGVEDVDVSSVVNLSSTTAPGSYTIPTALSEAATAKREFIPDKHILKGIGVQLRAGGSATWTLTIHDENDATIGTVTKTTTTLESFGFVRFDLTTAVNVVAGATYHFHLTVNSGTFTLYTDTASSMADCGYKAYYQILDTDTDYHPMVFYPSAQGIVIGNGRWLALYDGITYRTSGQGDGSERLSTSQDEKIRCLDMVGDYLAIGTWKGDGIDDHAYSNLYLWDGDSAFVNSFKPVTGEINAIKTGDDGLLYIWHGGFGNISIFDGGLTLVKTIPLVGENKNVEIYPGAVSTWRGIIRFGISGGDSTTVARGIYSYGRVNKDYSRSLNLDALASPGVSGSAIQITALLGIGPSKFAVAWKDTTSGTVYGVDFLDTSNDQGTVSYESLIFDAGIPYLEKKSKTIKITFPALTSGQSIKIYTKRDRASSWTLLGTADTVGAIEDDWAFDTRWKELEIKVELITTGASSPGLISITTFFDIIRDIQE